jgi:bifunctional non-homologous end joining protein LigD
MKPMLATAVASLPSGRGRAFEFKSDGVRALLEASERTVRLHSRTGNDVSAAYPELAELAGAPAGDALVDGEIVAFVDGRPSFERLQARMHVRSPAAARQLAAETRVTFVAFDLLRCYGVDLTGRAYVERRATLDRWVSGRPEWTLSPFFDDGPATEAAARQHGLEGVIGKRLASLYRPGARSRDWVKLKFVRSAEFIVMGWESAAERPEELSSLILAEFRAGRLRYAGKVGSGLTGGSAAVVRARLVPQPQCAVEDSPPPMPGRIAHWVRPELVVEVQFTLRTGEGRLRNPVLRGIRPDKSPEEADGNG